MSGSTCDVGMIDQLEHSKCTCGEVHMLTVGKEGEKDNSELTCKASCWGFSLEDFRETQAKDQDLHHSGVVAKLGNASSRRSIYS